MKPFYKITFLLLLTAFIHGFNTEHNYNSSEEYFPKYCKINTPIKDFITTDISFKKSDNKESIKLTGHIVLNSGSGFSNILFTGSKEIFEIVNTSKNQLYPRQNLKLFNIYSPKKGRAPPIDHFLS